MSASCVTGAAVLQGVMSEVNAPLRVPWETEGIVVLEALASHQIRFADMLPLWGLLMTTLPSFGQVWTNSRAASKILSMVRTKSWRRLQGSGSPIDDVAAQKLVEASQRSIGDLNAYGQAYRYLLFHRYQVLAIPALQHWKTKAEIMACYSSSLPNNSMRDVNATATGVSSRIPSAFSFLLSPYGHRA